MEEPTAFTQIAAAFILRIYGIACVSWGLIALWLTIKLGTHGAANWTRLWPEFALSVVLGISVFLLFRWLVLTFTILSTGVGIFYIGFTLMADPFPPGLFNLLIPILLIIPALLTHHAWHSLR